MKIVLQRHHWSKGVQHDPGETIDVTPEEYEFIMDYYKRERLEEVKSSLEIQAATENVGALTPQQEKEADAIGKKV